MGVNQIAVRVVTDPAFVEELVDIITEFMVDLAKQCVQQGSEYIISPIGPKLLYRPSDSLVVYQSIHPPFVSCIFCYNSGLLAERGVFSA